MLSSLEPPVPERVRESARPRQDVPLLLLRSTYVASGAAWRSASAAWWGWREAPASVPRYPAIPQFIGRGWQTPLPLIDNPGSKIKKAGRRALPAGRKIAYFFIPQA